MKLTIIWNEAKRAVPAVKIAVGIALVSPGLSLSLRDLSKTLIRQLLELS
jgi:hypothetical protein